MAHQTSAIQRKQATPHSIGRLMDVDSFEGHFFYFPLHMSRCRKHAIRPRVPESSRSVAERNPARSPSGPSPGHPW
jgi:hypothetical protein